LESSSAMLRPKSSNTAGKEPIYRIYRV